MAFLKLTTHIAKAYGICQWCPPVMRVARKIMRMVREDNPSYGPDEAFKHAKKEFNNNKDKYKKDL